MSSAHHLREFISERLTAAAAEIFSEFEATILRYEEELDRQRRLLDVCWRPELKLHRVELQQDPVHRTQILQDQQLCKQGEPLAQPPWIKEEEDGPEPVQIKAEEEELCTIKEEDQLRLNLVTAEPDGEQLISQSAAGPEDRDSGSNENVERPPRKTDHADGCHEGEGVFVRPEEGGPVEESTAAVDEAEVAQVESQEPQNPWSHLEDYYVFTSRDKSNAKILCFRCVMCQPKEITIKGQVASFYNLKSHVRRKHPAHAVQFEERIKAGSSRGKHRRCFGSSTSSSALQPCAKRARHLGIGETFAQTAGAGVPQSMVDRRIVELFGDDALSLRVVESPAFVGLIKMLNPNKTSMSCCTLSGRIMASQKELEEYLTRPSTGTGPQDAADSNRPVAPQPGEELQSGPEETRTSTDQSRRSGALHQSGGRSAPPEAGD